MPANFYKLFSNNIHIRYDMLQKLFSTDIYQLFVTYKNHKFHIIIQEEDKNLTVLQINYTRKFKFSLDPMPEHTSAPISIQESLSPITLQTLTNFEFSEETICAIFDKMIDAKIKFNEIK